MLYFLFEAQKHRDEAAETLEAMGCVGIAPTHRNGR